MNYIDNNAHIRRIHWWLHYYYGKATHCSNDITHQSKRFEWANISGEYKKDINDFKQLCVSCHRKFDIRDSFRKRMSEVFSGNSFANKGVKQLDKNGNVLNEFNSIRQAGKQLDILPSSIVNNLKGTSKSAGGFLWDYIT